MRAVALLSGAYNLGRHKAVEMLTDLIGVRISLGAVNAVDAQHRRAN